MSCTSAAAPFVSGAIALVRTKFDWENYNGLRDRILMGVDTIGPSQDGPGLQGVFRTGGRLNLWKPLQPRNVIRNLSARARVESGNRIMIGGFIVGGSGTGTLKVAIRALGPSLDPLSVARLNDPKLQLHKPDGTSVINTDWGLLPAGQKDELRANDLAPINSRESAMVVTLSPGAYTVELTSQDGIFGVGVLELYELEGGNNQRTRLQNLSARCLIRNNVDNVDEKAIVGAIVGNPANVQNRRMLMIGSGPSLASQGIANPIQNPRLELYDTTTTPAVFLDSNDQWRDIDGTATALQSELIQAGFESENASHNNDAALCPTFRPERIFTAIMDDAGGVNGVGLLEFYEY
ncbi:MAG: hypothetical protein H0U23_00170 [Blastocatellia bacterium]|nr:hypothetical protein [Blastocatellia bacterium]